MPRKKKEELEAENQAGSQDETTTEETAVEASAEETAATEEKPKRTRKAKAEASDETATEETTEETTEESSILSSVVDTVSAAVGTVASAVAGGVSSVVSAVTGDSSATGETKSHHSKRAEKIGIVQSDKMTKTVTVRVDRQVKHPVYRKYIKRRKNFMAHDELGATVGDKVRIIETRPLSARKRWRVVEIVQKAVK